jgi:hypothetical protein
MSLKTEKELTAQSNSIRNAISQVSELGKKLDDPKVRIGTEEENEFADWDERAAEAFPRKSIYRSCKCGKCHSKVYCS